MQAMKAHKNKTGTGASLSGSGGRRRWPPRICLHGPAPAPLSPGPEWLRMCAPQGAHHLLHRRPPSLPGSYLHPLHLRATGSGHHTAGRCCGSSRAANVAKGGPKAWSSEGGDGKMALGGCRLQIYTAVVVTVQCAAPMHAHCASGCGWHPCTAVCTGKGSPASCRPRPAARCMYLHPLAKSGAHAYLFGPTHPAIHTHWGSCRLQNSRTELGQHSRGCAAAHGQDSQTPGRRVGGCLRGRAR